MPPPIHRTVPLERPLDDAGRRLLLSLLGTFELNDGAATVLLGAGSQRLLAFVALQDRPVSRDKVAEALWPEGSEAQARASLRSAIWRLEEIGKHSLSISPLELDLAPEVTVDLLDAKAMAHRILVGNTMPEAGDITPEAIALLASELLPDWYDDWAIIRAEDWRQLRVHALEALAQKFLDAGRFADAIEAAAEAEKVDGLRESPHSMLIRIHLAEGNQSEAVKEFHTYRQLVNRELGIEPTAALRDLVVSLLP